MESGKTWKLLFTDRDSQLDLGLDWLGHSNTCIFFDLNHSIVALAVLLGSLSSWKVKLHPSPKCFADSNRFLPRNPLFHGADGYKNVNFGLIWPEHLPPNVCCAPHMACGKLHGFVSQCLSSCHSSIKARFVECMTNSCPVDRFSHLSCGSLQLLQSYHGPNGCF